MDNREMNRIIRIVLLVVVAVLVVLAGLTFIPRTRTLNYNMQGYVIQPDGQIVEHFPFTITGKEYDFIIDPPGSAISFTGNKLEKVEDDAYILYFNWDSAPFSKSYSLGNFIGKYHFKNPRFVSGTLTYDNPISNQSHFESGMLDIENNTFCLYVDNLMDNAIIVGVPDSDTDPLAVLESFQELVEFPKLPSTSEN